MKRLFLIAVIALLTATLGHAADDIVVDGVTYTYNNGTYIVTGWDGETPIQSLHILGELDEGFVEGIANGAFEDNEDIDYLTIDEGIGYIGQDAFNGCINLEVAILPKGLVTIDERAFAFCTSLTEFVIPSTVQNIQAQAFFGCTNVTDVYFLMTEEEQLENFVWWDGWYQNVPGDYVSSDPHGGIEFNRSRKPYEGDDERIEHNLENGTMIHVPAGTYNIYNDSGKLEAWLFDDEEDECHPLWWIVNYGVVGLEYTVCDDLLAVYSDVESGVYAKDNNGWLTPDKVYSGEIDYMHTNNYDQSNWVVLRNVTDATLLGHYINVTGILLDKKNPEIEVTSTPINKNEDDDPIVYEPNVYIPCSFMGRAQVGANERTYAFVQPKPQEYIKVERAIYNAETDEFYIPAPYEEIGCNLQELCGGFKVNYDLYEQPSIPELKDWGHYVFEAINRRTVMQEEKYASIRFLKGETEESSYFEPYVEGGLSSYFTVFPLNLPKDPIPTAIAEIDTTSMQADNNWYSIDGRYLGIKKPIAPGIYLNNKKKVVVTQ